MAIFPVFGMHRSPTYESIHDQINRIFEGLESSGNIRQVARSSFPEINVGASDESFEIVAFIPGLSADDISVMIEKRILTISGQRTASAEEKGKVYYARERAAGEFRRVVELPADIDPDSAEAKYQDGCLHISIRKSESSKPRAISVN